MEFERGENAKRIGREVGFFVGYAVFFHMMYFILNFLGKMPFRLNYNYFIASLLLLFIFGKTIRGILNGNG